MSSKVILNLWDLSKVKTLLEWTSLILEINVSISPPAFLKNSLFVEKKFTIYCLSILRSHLISPTIFIKISDANRILSLKIIRLKN